MHFDFQTTPYFPTSITKEGSRSSKEQCTILYTRSKECSPYSLTVPNYHGPYRQQLENKDSPSKICCSQLQTSCCDHQFWAAAAAVESLNPAHTKLNSIRSCSSCFKRLIKINMYPPGIRPLTSSFSPLSPPPLVTHWLLPNNSALTLPPLT